MLKLEVKSKNYKFECSIDSKKFIYGDNYLLKQNIYGAIKKSFSNINHSEYALEKNKDATVYINDREVDTKSWKFYEITHKADYETNMKMGSKTIMYKYFESILMDIEYNELINTINTLYKDLNEEILERMQELKTMIRIEPILPDFNSKIILKLLDLGLYGEDFRANSFDIDYSDGLLMQVQMIKKICEVNNTKNYIVLIDVPYIEDMVMTEIIENKVKNLYYIVITNQKLNIDCKDVINISNKIIDFGNDVDVYNNVILEANQHYELDEIYNLLNEYLRKKDTDEVKDLLSIL